MPRGANLNTPKARAAADQKIRQRWLEKVVPLREPEPLGDDPDALSEVERRRAVAVARRARASFWATAIPTWNGEAVVWPSLPADLVLPWEDREAVLASEQPSQDGHRVEHTALGVLLHRPGRLPMLLGDEVKADSFPPPPGVWGLRVSG